MTDKIKRTVYDIITERISNALSEGSVAWRIQTPAKNPPTNFLTRKLYRGINVLMLALVDFGNPYFLTLTQVNALNARVKKGETGSPIVYWDWMEVENEDHELVKVYRLRYTTVFNTEQCTHIPAGLFMQQMMYPGDALALCDALLAEMVNPPAVIHQGEHPHYVPEEDCIILPEKSAFSSTALYYEILFMMLITSTGHERRLNKPELLEYVPETFSFGELVAEIGACFLKAHVGLVYKDEKPTEEYLTGWNEAITNDKKLLLNAATWAQKAVDYILSDGSETSKAAPHELEG